MFKRNNYSIFFFCIFLLFDLSTSVASKDFKKENDISYLLYERDKAHRNVTIEYWTISGKVKNESNKVYYWTSSFYKSGFTALPSIFNYAIVYVVDVDKKSFSFFTYGNPSMVISAEKAISSDLKEDLENKDLKDALERVKNKIFTNFALMPEPYGIASSEKPFLLYGPLKFERLKKNEISYSLKTELLDYALEVKLESNDLPLNYDKKNILKVGDTERAEGYVIGKLKTTGRMKKNDIWEKVIGEFFYTHMWGNWNKASAWKETNRILIVLENGIKLDYHTFKDGKGNKKIEDQIFIMKDKNIEKIEGPYLNVIGKWDSIASKRKYKIDWRINIPQKKIDLHIAPILKQQEVSVIENRGAFWFGSCEVNGNVDGKNLKGIALVKSQYYEKISNK